MIALFSVAICWILLSGVVPTIGQDSTLRDEGEWRIVFYAGHFSYEQMENSGLYWMREDGSGKELLISEKELVKNHQGDTVSETNLSPNGQEIAYTLDDDKGISVYDLETKQITELEEGFSPIWSPDSHKVAFISYTGNTADGALLSEVHVVDLLIGDDQTVIASRDIILEPQPNTRYLWQMAWSPDGEKLVISVQLTPGPLLIGDDLIQIHKPGNTLVMVNLDGSGLLKILPEDIQGYRPVWLDQNTIYFICYTQQDQPPAKICRLNLETSTIDTIGDFRDILPENEWVVDISVRPDEMVTFSRSYLSPEGKRGDLYTFDLNTNALTNLDEDGTAINGSVQWLYRSLSMVSS